MEAIATFDEAIELNPNFAAAYHERGRAKLLNGDKEGSVEDMEKSLELNPREEAALNGQFNNQEKNSTTYWVLCIEQITYRISFLPSSPTNKSKALILLFIRDG